MPELLPLARDQRQADADHLRILAIFHFVVAGLSLVGLGFLGLHYTMIHFLFAQPGMWKNQTAAGPPPAQIFAVFKWFYLVFGAIWVIGGLGNLYSGICLQKRTHRTFSLVMSAVNCVHFPFGTVLGVFTFVVLLRDSEREAYRA
jgi:hypothetical protein